MLWGTERRNAASDAIATFIGAGSESEVSAGPSYRWAEHARLRLLEDDPGGDPRCNLDLLGVAGGVVPAHLYRRLRVRVGACR